MESYRTFGAAQDRVRVYQEEILPKAQKALDQTNEGYRLGKFGYLDVLDAQRTLADSTKALTAALADLNLAASDLETLTGMRLETVR
jgi:cobalt-zinc-cadmium efflux system outer membrane protein